MRLGEEELYRIIDGTVSIEKKFVCDALPVRLVGMDRVLMGRILSLWLID